MNLLKWAEQCQKSLDYVKKIITTSPILVCPDAGNQYYIFADDSKHSWSGSLVQNTKQMKEDNKI